MSRKRARSQKGSSANGNWLWLKNKYQQLHLGKSWRKDENLRFALALKTNEPQLRKHEPFPATWPGRDSLSTRICATPHAPEGSLQVPFGQDPLQDPSCMCIHIYIYIDIHNHEKAVGGTPFSVYVSTYMLVYMHI